MPSAASNLPDAHDLAAFRADPLTWLGQARDERGPVFAVPGSGAVFSRVPDCSGVVAVFGADHVKQVLVDTESFAMPASAAGKLGLPRRLAQLNRSLHSMREPEHGAHKRALGSLLGTTAVDQPAARRAMQACTRHWTRPGPQPLLARMRELSLALAHGVLLGPGADPDLADLLHRYFLLRREVASPAAASGSALRASMLATGDTLEQALHRYLRQGPASGGMLGRMLCPGSTAGQALSEDDAVGHANILFVSATEPVAVALTWTLLLLTQRPALAQSVRNDAAALDELLLESLRLLPPNGFMVRLTTRPVQLGGLCLPERCEAILCPFLAHRDARVFAQPGAFLPQRWRHVRPTAFEYFPFGAGGHACVGRSLGMELLRTALGFVMQHFDTVLDADQDIDWRIHIMFMPRDEIPVRFVPPGTAQCGGRWSGPVSTWIELGV